MAFVHDQLPIPGQEVGHEEGALLVVVGLRGRQVQHGGIQHERTKGLIFSSGVVSDSGGQPPASPW